MATRYRFTARRATAQDETTINYRGAHGVRVASEGLQKTGKHAGEVKLKTLERVGNRPKGSIDYRQPQNVHHS